MSEQEPANLEQCQIKEQVSRFLWQTVTAYQRDINIEVRGYFLGCVFDPIIWHVAINTSLSRFGISDLKFPFRIYRTVLNATRNDFSDVLGFDESSNRSRSFDTTAFK